MKLIISANDGSDGAGRAVAFAAAFANSFDAKLLIVHVSDDKFSQKHLAQLEQLKVTEGDALEQISLRILSNAKAIAKDHGATNIDTMTAAGDPAKVLRV
jgi:nucleotide-binding universal stress UspA family protein